MSLAEKSCSPRVQNAGGPVDTTTNMRPEDDSPPAHSLDPDRVGKDPGVRRRESRQTDLADTQR